MSSEIETSNAAVEIGITEDMITSEIIESAVKSANSLNPAFSKTSSDASQTTKITLDFLSATPPKTEISRKFKKKGQLMLSRSLNPGLPGFKYGPVKEE